MELMQLSPMLVFMNVQTRLLTYTMPMMALTSVATATQIISPSIALVIGAYTIGTATVLGVVATIPTLIVSGCYYLCESFTRLIK